MGLVDQFKKCSCMTPCGKLKGSTILHIFKVTVRVIKSFLARILYTLYILLAIWRVVEAKDNKLFWLLALTLIPLAGETLYTTYIRKSYEYKWLTPSVFCYMVGAIPCLWVLQFKLLDDRMNTKDMNCSESDNVDIYNLSDEDWTEILLQLMVFVLVFAKWIAPKGQMSNGELSQLLLVYFGSGADILELLEAFKEKMVNKDLVAVATIMTVWSWSLLQFTFVLTASRELPSIDDDFEEVVIGGKRVSMFRNQEEEKEEEDSKNGKEKQKTLRKSFSSNAKNTEFNICDETKGITNAGLESEETRSNPYYQPNDISESLEDKKGHEKQISDIEVISINSKSEQNKPIHKKNVINKKVSRIFNCFCFYTEVWGILMTILFQDGPFLVVRMVLLFHFGIITQSNLFFSAKNVLVLLLLFNRIRIIISEEYKPWVKYMIQTKEKNKEQEKGRTSSESAANEENHTRARKALPKPRWLIWRA